MSAACFTAHFSGPCGSASSKTTLSQTSGQNRGSRDHAGVTAAALFYRGLIRIHLTSNFSYWLQRGVSTPFQHSDRGGLHFKDSSLLILKKKKRSYGVTDCLVPFNPIHAKTNPCICTSRVKKLWHYQLEGCALQIQDGGKNIKSNKAWLVNLHMYLSNRLINSRKCNIRR